MALKYRRIPPGFSAADLGEAGEMETGQTCQKIDCFLVCEQPSPVTCGYPITYHVLFSHDDEGKQLAAQVEVIEWTKSIMRNKEWILYEQWQVHADSKYEASKGAWLEPECLTFEAEESLPHRIDVTLYADSGATPIRTLRLDQRFKSKNTAIERFREEHGPKWIHLLVNMGLFAAWDFVNPIEQIKAEMEEISILGSPDKLQEFLDLYYPLFISAVEDTDSVTDVPLQLLAAVYYSENFLHPYSQISKLYLDYRVFAAGKVVGNEGYVVTGPKMIVGDPHVTWECQDNPCRNMTSDTKQDLILLNQLLKPHIRITFELLNRIKFERLRSLTMEELWWHENDYLAHLVDELCHILWGRSVDASVYEKPAEKCTFFSFARAAAADARSPYIQIICSGGIGARVATASVKRASEAGEIESVHDYLHWGILKGILPGILTGRPPDPHSEDSSPVWQAEHFGWTPAQEIKNSIIQTDKEMIFADAGFWGHYDRANPRRDFLMIEGRTVWLCRLVCDESEEVMEGCYSTTLQLLKNHPIASALVERVHDDWTYSVEIVSVAEAQKSIGESMPSRLTVVFPDMHLPEKWPDVASVADYSGAQVLRRELRRAQHTQDAAQISPDSWLFRRFRVQQYISKLTDGTSETLPIGSFSFTPKQVSDEIDLLERKFRIDSSWFYPPAKNPTGEIDLGSSFRGDAPDLAALEGDPAPAIDMIVLLSSIVSIQNSATVNNVRVVQVGDMFEMWMGREWLYREFPRVPEDDLDNEYRKNDAPISGNALILVANTGTINADRYQYRLGGNWMSHLPKYKNSNSLSANLLAGIKDASLNDEKPLYVFHKWPIEDLRHRHRTGDNIIEEEKKKMPNGALDRAIAAVKARMDSIEEFSLPLPESLVNSYPTPRKKAVERINRDKSDLEPGEIAFLLDDYKRTNTNEFYWNKLVLDGFIKTKAEMVAGNHDNYRADQLLNNRLSGDKKQKAKYWISGDGLWIEHAHRWDPYNREGVPAGAGITNLCHYYFRPLLESNNEIKGEFLPSFHQQTLPGAAQWFLIINQPTGSPFNDVKPFAVYIVGHSHHPDLLRVGFKEV